MPEEKPTHTVKLRPSTCGRMYRVVELISKNGWSEVGTARGDQPTQANVIDEALAQLEAKFKKGKS